MNIKEQLEQYIEQRANEVGATASTSPRDNFDIAKLSYTAGTNEMKELLLIAVDALEGISKAKCSGADVYSFADAAKFDAIETLKEIQEKIKDVR